MVSHRARGDKWVQSEHRGNEWLECLAKAPAVLALREKVRSQVCAISPDYWLGMDAPDQRFRRDGYFLRYSVPLAELYGWPQRRGSKLDRGLACHLLWAFAWRALDDVLDSERTDHGAVERAAVAVLRAGHALATCTKRHSPQGQFISEEMLSLLCRTAAAERRRPVPIRNIWRRAAPFLVAPISLLCLEEHSLNAYKELINLDGLVHDAHDVLHDSRAGIASVPLKWFSDVDSYAPFRADVISNWAHRASIEIGRQLRRVRTHFPVGRFPCTDLVIKEAETVRQEYRRLWVAT